MKIKNKRRFVLFINIFIGICFIVISFYCLYCLHIVNKNIQQKQLGLIKQSVDRAIVHCYALEGSYPANLDYLKENYGLILDTKHYIYHYEIFATNIKPTVNILKKG